MPPPLNKVQEPIKHPLKPPDPIGTDPLWLPGSRKAYRGTDLLWFSNWYRGTDLLILPQQGVVWGQECPHSSLGIGGQTYCGDTKPKTVAEMSGDDYVSGMRPRFLSQTDLVGSGSSAGSFCEALLSFVGDALRRGCPQLDYLRHYGSQGQACYGRAGRSRSWRLRLPDKSWWIASRGNTGIRRLTVLLEDGEDSPYCVSEGMDELIVDKRSTDGGNSLGAIGSHPLPTGRPQKKCPPSIMSSIPPAEAIDSLERAPAPPAPH